MARFWFSYDNINNLYHPASYRRQSSNPGCLNGPVLCTIYAPGAGSQPTIISHNMRRYIANGVANNIAQPAFPTGSKFYVYLKGLSQ